jgi:hypothetical protein
VTPDPGLTARGILAELEERLATHDLDRMAHAVRSVRLVEECPISRPK